MNKTQIVSMGTNRYRITTVPIRMSPERLKILLDRGWPLRTEYLIYEKLSAE